MRILFALFLLIVTIGANANETNPPVAAVSNALPSTITIDGTTYEEVRWQGVTPTTVTIFHKTGVATFPLEKLPSVLQKQLGYDPAKAADWRKAEQERVAAWQKAQQQQKERLQFEKENVQELDGEVTDVIEGKGVILNNHREVERNAQFMATMAGVNAAWAQSGAPNPNPQVSLDTQVRSYFLACDTKQLVNGSYVKCRAYQDGFYTYTTVMGGSQKIVRWMYFGPVAEQPKN
ncbi:MAG: hypothetical protein ACLPT4_10380 [Verrucomicrobiia bacterium]